MLPSHSAQVVPEPPASNRPRKNQKNQKYQKYQKYQK